MSLPKRDTFLSATHRRKAKYVSEILQCHLYYLEICLSCKMNFLSQNSEFAFPLRFDFLTTRESNNLLVLMGMSCTVIHMLP